MINQLVRLSILDYFKNPDNGFNYGHEFDYEDFFLSYQGWESWHPNDIGNYVFHATILREIKFDSCDCQTFEDCMEFEDCMDDTCPYEGIYDKEEIEAGYARETYSFMLDSNYQVIDVDQT